jgi:hypothetical protein
MMDRKLGICYSQKKMQIVFINEWMTEFLHNKIKTGLFRENKEFGSMILNILVWQ